MVRFVKEKDGRVLTSVDVVISDGDSFELGVNCTPQEAFTIMSLPSFSALVTNLIPNYELPEMSEEEC